MSWGGIDPAPDGCSPERERDGEQLPLYVVLPFPRVEVQEVDVFPVLIYDETLVDSQAIQEFPLLVYVQRLDVSQPLQNLLFVLQVDLLPALLPLLRVVGLDRLREQVS